MISGRGVVGWFVVIVGHQVYGIEIFLHFAHFRVLQKGSGGAGGGSEEEMAIEALFFFVQALAKFLEQKRVIALVFATKAIPRTYLGGIFPIDVEAIEFVTSDKHDHAVNEPTAAPLVQRHIREIARSQPAADRDKHGQRRIRTLQ